jgi:hypothetical protein
MKPLIVDIIQMLKDRPLVETSENWPNENGLYSLSGIKKYMRSKGYTNDMVDQAIYHIENDNNLKLNCVKIKNKKYKENYPYFYIDIEEKELEQFINEYNSHK